MKIIVIGCGKIGTTILASLVSEGHEVVAVDGDADAISEISNIYDVMSVCGNGADCDTLAEAGVDGAELVVAVTGSDELNMLSCFLARRMGAKHTIARIRNPEYNDRSLGFMRQQLGLSLSINPEMLAAQELYRILRMPTALNVETFSRRNFEMVELRLKSPTPLDGVQISDLRKRYDANFLICAVKRGEETYIPDGNFVLRAGDRIGLMAAPNELQKLLKMLGLMQKQARNVMILGASKTAYYLSKMLLSGGCTVKLIELDRDKCLEYSDTLPGVVMICGDGARQELLLEEGIRSTDAFVTLTGMDEENILISCYAASQAVPKVITKVNRNELISMASKLGLDCMISPKKIVSDILVRYARALNSSIGSKMETMYKIMDGSAEAVEFIVGEDFSHIGTSLRDMRLKPHTLIAGIMRGRKAIIPAGHDTIQPGDHVIVLSADRHIVDLGDILC